MLQRIATLLILLVACLPLSAQWLDLPTPGIPRTADGKPDLTAPTPKDANGHPDLSGLWVPLEARGSLFDLDKIQGWARQLMEEHGSNFFGNEPRFSCMPSGPASYPAGALAAGLRRIVQQPTFLAILNSRHDISSDSYGWARTRYRSFCVMDGIFRRTLGWRYACRRK